jgi:hypothetical protein
MEQYKYYTRHKYLCSNIGLWKHHPRMSTVVKYPDVDHATVQLYPPLPQQPHPGHQILHSPMHGNSTHAHPSSDGHVAFTVAEGQHANWLVPELPPCEHPSAPIEGNFTTVAPQATAAATRPMIPVVASYTRHIVLAGLVFCCCGWLFGLVAFVLASKIGCMAISLFIISE